MTDLFCVEGMRRVARSLQRAYLDGLLEVSARRHAGERLLVLFLGSTIGNFDRPAAEVFLSQVRQILADGDLLLLVPAVPAIYGTLDRAFDHYRRYTKSGLKSLLLGSGFRVEKLQYINLIGVVAWFVSGKVLRRRSLGRAQVLFYDRMIIPWLRRLESLVPPPIGQSLVAIARKQTPARESAR